MMLEEIKYSVLNEKCEIAEYVVSVCEDEWDPDDFENYGEDLYKQTWTLNEVYVASILPQKRLLESAAFIADVVPRIAKQRELHQNGIEIPPLILRGRDLFIFDGYARWHFFNELGVKKCYAYISGV